MANNKVVLNDGTTLVDLTDTTATTNDVLSGQVFYGANGVRSVGTLEVTENITVVITLESGSYVADKTYAEIIANIEAGGIPRVRYGNAFYPLDSYNSSYLTFQKHIGNNLLVWYIYADGRIVYGQSSNNRVLPITLSASQWTNGEYTISSGYIASNNIVTITYPATITDEQLDTISKARLRYISQVQGSIILKARGSVPTIDIPITLIVEVV